MSKVVILDTTPHGILANPKLTQTVRTCRRWVSALIAGGCTVVIPEIADYEVRRELIRGGRTLSIQSLDALAVQFNYLPLNTVAMRIAAELWAYARNIGQPISHDRSLDCDTVLCAQTHALSDPTAIIATGNPAHLVRFAPAADWQTIAP